MELEKEQINLLHNRRKERMDFRLLWPSRDNLLFLKNFFFRNQKTLFRRSLLFLAAQSIVEIILIILSHRYLNSNIQLQEILNNFNLLIILAILAGIYLFVAWQAIKSERTMTIRLINNLRAKWFRLELEQSAKEMDPESQSRLIAKMSYHLPLLSLGVTNSLTGSVRYLVLIIILFFLNLALGWGFSIFLMLAAAFSLIIAVAAFFISKNYVSREATFYSQIIRLVDFSLSDWRFTKFFNREPALLENFNYLVELDSYFRVRRDLWLRYSASIIFVILIFISWFISLSHGSLNSWLETTPDLKFLSIIFLVYFSRLLYEALRIGLYIVPFLLGLQLSIPIRNPRPTKTKRKISFSELIFKASRTKLFKKSRTYKNLIFHFKPGERYLITGEARQGKTFLARLLTGHGIYGMHAWIIKLKDKRFFYNDFFSYFKGFYFIDPDFTSARSILEVCLGQEKDNISEKDFNTVASLVEFQPELHDLFFEKDDWRLQASKFMTNKKNTLLLQVIYCIIKKPVLITIDNYWLDCNDSEVNKLLGLLERSLDKSVLIFFSKPQTNQDSIKAPLFNYTHSQKLE